jgi:hypothetical protein
LDQIEEENKEQVSEKRAMSFIDYEDGEDEINIQKHESSQYGIIKKFTLYDQSLANQ